MNRPTLERSRALWNRKSLNLASDEMLVQILDRGEIDAWRELYRLARDDADLRRRIKHIVLTVPISMPRFWLAALATLEESVDLDSILPEDDRPAV